MLHILTGNTIQLTRGDTASLSVAIFNEVTQEGYSVKENDTLRLTVKENVKSEQILIQKEVVGTNKLVIDPEDTKPLTFGKYTYDVELETEFGDISTIIEPSTFEVLPEVS